MKPGPWAIQSQRVLTPDGIVPGSLVIDRGRIVEVRGHGSTGDLSLVDHGNLLILPGLVDLHVHINDPGRSEWEGFPSATASAAVGGITTLIDMPLNSHPVTTSVAALTAKREAARGQLRVDCGFYGGLVPGNLLEVEPLADAGVIGFKAFLCHSGIDEFPNVTEADLRAAMPILACRGLPLLAHAEIVPESAPGMDRSDPRSYAAWRESRPEAFELAAIELLIELCHETGCHVQIVHLATSQALPMIAEARAEGLPLTVETCPHYLTFAAEEIPDGDTRFKCAPPIRSRANCEGLWEGLKSGLIDTIGTDHSPAPPDLKQIESGDLARAWGGISSLQLSLSAVWTEARARGFALEDVLRWMAGRPAEVVGLGARKGKIAPGFDADLVVFDPDAWFVVDPSQLHHRHPATPYEGRTLFGQVVATYLHGVRIAADGRLEGDPSGRTLGVGLDRLNGLGEPEAVAELVRCCGSRRWAGRMAELRPFFSDRELFEAADAVWGELEGIDRREAFAAHPRIGDLDSLRAKFGSTASWAAQEQSGVSGAADSTLEDLAEGNRAYEARFGYLFLVCATGKSALEMNDLLHDRLRNDPETEWVIASGEQARIARIRLEKLVR